MNPDKQTKAGWRRKAWCDDFGCGLSFSHKLEKEGIIETQRVGPKMTIIKTSPAEALAKLAERDKAAA